MYEGICFGPNPNIRRALLQEKANEHDYKQTRLHLTCGLLLFSFKTRGGFKETRGKVNSSGLRMQTLSEMQWPGLKFDTITVFWQHFIKEYAEITEIGKHRLRGRHKGKNTHLFAHSICTVLANNSLKESYIRLSSQTYEIPILRNGWEWCYDGDSRLPQSDIIYWGCVAWWIENGHFFLLNLPFCVIWSEK